MGFTGVLLAGRPGKLVKPAADIMYLHSHTAGGQREVLCTHAALAGADQMQVRQLYQCNTTREMTELLQAFPFGEQVWQIRGRKASVKTVCGAHMAGCRWD